MVLDSARPDGPPRAPHWRHGRGPMGPRIYIENYFESIEDITMYSIKENYLHILENIDNPDENWKNIYDYFQSSRSLKIENKNNEKDSSNLTSITKM